MNRATDLTRRPRRRTAAAIMAVVLLSVGLAGLIAVVVRLATGAPDRAAVQVTEWLVARSWGDPIVIMVATGAALIGAGLICAALKPGPPAALLLQSPGGSRPAVQAAIRRRSVSRWLSWRLSQVSGVDEVKVQVAHRLLRVRVETATRYTDAVRDQVYAVAEHAVADAGFARPPRVQVQVRQRT